MCKMCSIEHKTCSICMLCVCECVCVCVCECVCVATHFATYTSVNLSSPVDQRRSTGVVL